VFYAEIWRECCPIIRQKNLVWEFLFFASFKTYDNFSEENACFLKTQSLTACQKQTRQVIKISQHGFSEKEDTAMLITSSHSNQPETNLISDLLSFEK